MPRSHPSDDRGVPLRYLIPNLITTTSLCCGLAAIHFAIKAAFPATLPVDDAAVAVVQKMPRFNNWDRALAGVALAMIFDGLDGRAARLLRVSSQFGAVLDSLSDFVCFGVAPALILYLWGLREEEAFGFAAVVCFTICSAFRLARFTALAWGYVASAVLAMGVYHKAMVREGVTGPASWSVGLSVREQIRRAKQDAAH